MISQDFVLYDQYKEHNHIFTHMKIPLLEEKHTFFSQLSRCTTTASSVSSLNRCTTRMASNFSPINNNKVKHFHRLKSSSDLFNLLTLEIESQLVFYAKLDQHEYETCSQ